VAADTLALAMSHRDHEKENCDANIFTPTDSESYYSLCANNRNVMRFQVISLTSRAAYLAIAERNALAF